MKQIFSSIKGKFVPIAAGGIGLLALLAAGAYASHSWNGYHWARTANPFTLELGDNVSSAWYSYLDTASTDWSGGSAVLDTAIVAGGTNNTRGKYTPKNCVPTSGRVEVCNAKYGFNGWLGVASVWVSGTHIVQGTVKVNDSYFKLSTYNTPAWKRMVMCQEVAHTFGLDHQDEDFDNPNLGSCMDYTSDPDGPPSNEHPNPHDLEQIETMYAHLDSTTTIGQAASGPGNRAGNEADGQEVAEWGKAIRTSSDGKPSLYERDLGNGQKVFTFVFWADRGAK